MVSAQCKQLDLLEIGSYRVRNKKIISARISESRKLQSVNNVRLFTTSECWVLALLGNAQDVKLAVVEVCSRKEISTDHFQTVTSGLVCPQHQRSRISLS
jgi:hypothetical protein